MCDNNQAITMIRGTSATFSLTIEDESGNPYTLQADEVLRFGIKTTPTDSQYIFSVDFNVPDTDGSYSFSISPADTENLSFGSYWYDVGLQSGEDDYWNVIPASAFYLAYNVTGLEA